MTVQIADDLDKPRDTDLSSTDLAVRLESLWKDKPGFWGWLTSVNHKSIGIRYIITAFVFLLLGGLLAGLVRLQLAGPDKHVLGPDQFNQVFTMHGTTMIFLFAVPMMEAIGVYIVPLMVGSRILAFPRLLAFSYWVYLFGGIFVWLAFFLNVGPDAGWFSYVPLAGPEYGTGKRSDIWAQMITFTEVSALAVAVSIIVTVFKYRAPGMSLNRIPIFVWAMLVTSFCIVFALPAIVLDSSMLLSDRLVATQFFNTAEGGDSLLWQHLFWFFGHPEVYIIFLPAVGMASTIVEAGARRRIFGYTAIVLAITATGFLSFGLWVHHMFATGLPKLGNSFFTATSMAIAIPSGLEIFCWLATLWGGKLRMTTALLFVIGFIAIFVPGGLTGVMVASVPFDLQATDTYFIVGHIHYVIMGGMMAPLLGAFYFWFPKFTGRMLSERLGRWHFWFYLAGVNLAFFPMLILGLRGMTRRIWTYQPEMGWSSLNLLSSLGALIIICSFAIFLINIFLTLRKPKTAPDNPWDAPNLEWSVSSPAPSYNFLHIPYVGASVTLWENREELPVVTGLRTDRKEVLVTTAIDAEPQLRDPVPDSTIWPLITAITTSIMFVGSVFTPQALIWGSIPIAFSLIGWLYPRGVKTGRQDMET